MRVKATREGLVGGTTASGWKIDTVMPFVALPSRRALYRMVRIKNPLNGKIVLAIVLDVGPHSDADNAYVFDGARPLAEKGISQTAQGTGIARNTAGIDLGEAVWKSLGMEDNTEVDWEFID